MGQLNLPPGAEAAFRIATGNAFGGRFSIHLYGAGRCGWYIASQRLKALSRDSGVRPLPKGDSPTPLHLIDRSGFWALPEDDAHLVDPAWAVLDGEWVSIAGRVGDRYHRVARSDGREPGLEAVLSYGRRVSGFFARNPYSGVWVPLDDPGAEVAPEPDASRAGPAQDHETGASPQL